MKSTCLMLLSAACMLVSAACRNAAGERVTVAEWFRPRSEAPASEARRTDPGSHVATPAPADTSDPGPTMADVGPGWTIAPSEAVRGESGSERTATLTTPRSRAQPDGDPRNTRKSSPHAVYSDALVVNDETLSVSDILEPILPSIEAARDHSPEVYYRKVHDLVRRQIVEAVAQHLIWHRARGELDEAFEPQIEKAVEKMEKERINREFNGSETRYTRYLARHRKTRQEIRQRLRRSVIIDGYLREHLLPLVPASRKDDLFRYYHRHIDRFSEVATREMFLIDVPIRAFLDAGKPFTETDFQEATAQARSAMETATAALKAGEPFDAVARQHSHGVNKNKGGNWGSISGPLQGRWAEPSRRLFELQPGEVSEIIETAQSFFIVKVGATTGGDVVSFQDAQPEIAGILRQERFAVLRGEFLQREWEQSSIGSLDAFVARVLEAVPPPGGSKG